MTNSTQRIVLLAGASLAAIGIANPANAAINPFPPSAGYPIVAGAINNTLIISNIGDPAATYGDTVVGNGVVTATVNTALNGEIHQSGTAGIFDAIFLATNAGVVTVKADAAAFGIAALQSANAVLDTGFYQYGKGDDNASVTFNNSGTLNFGALAAADGLTANANATVTTGFHQQAVGVNGTATAVTTNSGTLTTHAYATADADLGLGSADAIIHNGIVQLATASGGAATVGLTNTSSGIIDQTARARATSTVGVSGNATASATVLHLIYQQAQASGNFNADVTLTNSGSITLDALATAKADGIARASATNKSAVSQFASATGGGNATVTLTNNASLDIDAVAVANGATAQANAVIKSGIHQRANANSGDATAAMTNNGTLTIHADGTAIASLFNATANAFIKSGISQSAVGSGGASASNSLTNSSTGVIDERAHASAVATNLAGTGGNATARALALRGIHQIASGSGGSAASDTLTNAGTITLHADAFAVADGTANAFANIKSGVAQDAIGNGTGDASALVSNSGALDIRALAHAAGATAAATARAANGIHQQVNANNSVVGTLVFLSGDALAQINNASTGVLSITADATAAAASGNANALATVTNAISQVANSAAGTATVGLTNAGSLSIGAAATASVLGAGLGAARATASVTDAIVQRATAASGAAITLDNSATLSITAHALANNAFGLASANANMSTLISQVANASGGDASVALTNSGTLNIHNGALASGSAAAANASGTEALIQQRANANGVGSDATIILTNSSAGVVNVTFQATANASVGNATATASIDTGIYQNARANGGGNAAATLTNNGTIDFTGTARAVATNVGGTGGNASASGTASDILSQVATANLGGSATATFTNSGTFRITGNAVAIADGSASAHASVSSGITQRATTNGGGDATALLTNSGTLALLASAKATGSNASAYASVTSGISQRAFAFTSAGPSGDAFATLTNSSTGILSLAARATAIGASGTATATAKNSSAIDQNARSASGNATNTLTNNGSLTILANAKATSTGTTAGTGNSAFAFARISNAIGQSATAAGAGGIATNNLSNTGTLTIAANAKAVAADSASATAHNDPAISQSAVASGNGTAANTLTNSAVLNITADAVATGGTHAFASGSVSSGIVQFASVVGTGNASDALTNSSTGTLTIRATGLANAASGDASASAYVDVGISQHAIAAAGTASATFTNNGTVNITADAQAIATTSADAFASVNTAIYQKVTGSAGATALFTNTATFAVAARADATGSTAAATGKIVYGVSQSGSSSAGNVALTINNSGALTFVSHAGAVASSSNAFAAAYLTQPIYQYANAPAGNASALVTNSNTFSALVDAKATSTGDAYAIASISSGIYQQAIAGAASGVATASITNSSIMTLGANAQAHGGTTVGGTGSARAFAYVTGATQRVSGFDGVLVFNNSGTFTVNGTAVADGGDQGFAQASVIGVDQHGNATNSNAINFTNSSTGKFLVSAKASATGGSTSTATASASGLDVRGGPLNLTVVNNGQFKVDAHATASSANAYAYGMTVNPTNDGVLTGTVSNAGTLTVAAVADGSNTSSASAVGIKFLGNVNNVVATNTGTIDVLAQTNGGPVSATGVRASVNGVGAPGLADVFTFTNNGGTVKARISTDGGATFQRGMAIDVATALGQSVINFTGAGSIYGNVDVKAGDVINVFAGETSFDGIVNPECMPPIKDGVSATCGQGTLNIGAGGSLYLRDTRNSSPTTFDGPAYAFVDTFNVAPTGRLVYDLPTTSVGGARPLGSYPQIFTNTANLAGTIEVRPDSQNGLYANNYFFDNVIDAVTMNGTFANCVLGNNNTPLLNLQCIYDTQENLDLSIVRVNFGDVPGLTGNGIGVAAGLDCLYTNTLTGGIGALVADIFTLTAPNYLLALQQLSGGSYASYLQSFDKLGVRYNDLIDHATDCEDPSLVGSVTECRTQPLHVWGQIQGATRSQRGDDFVGKVDGDQWTAMLGIDAAVAPAVVLGAELAKVTNGIDTNYGSHIRGDGYQVGLYGAYDPGNFYAKVMGTYSWLNGKARRDVDFRPLGGTTFGHLNSNPDVRSWTAGAHFGYRIPMGGSVITPYVNFDHVDTKLKSFSEGGLSGVNLDVSGHEKRSFITGGGKFGINVGGGAMLQADLGWQHMFGRRYATALTAFSTDPSCTFDSFSSAQKRDSIRAGLSLGGKVGPFRVRAAYDGLYSSGEKTHAGSIKIVLPFGGAARR